MNFGRTLGPWLSSCAIAAAFALIGCGSDAKDSSQNQPNGVKQADDCAGRGEQFSAGMQKTSPGGVSIELVDANPAPPKLGDNAWTVSVRDASGGPMLAADVSVDPWMPEHGHGSNKEAIAVELGDGKYRIEPISLGMPGVWEIGVRINSGSKPESVTFAFCIPRS
jgi:hypothetical protein